jgi:hypothetical protein
MGGASAAVGLAHGVATARSCRFLERPVPAVPLPRVNDSGSFNAMVIGSAMQKLTACWSQQ